MATTNKAPVELVVIKFPKNEFRGEVVDALQTLVNDDIIKVIDILFVTKDKNGAVDVVELTDLDEEDYQVFTPIIADSAGMINKKDAQNLTKDMENDSSAGLMLFEDTWARELADAVSNAGGEVVISERVPPSLVEKMST